MLNLSPECNAVKGLIAVELLQLESPGGQLSEFEIAWWLEDKKYKFPISQ